MARDLHLRQNPTGTVVEWIDSGGSLFYDVIRGDLAQVRAAGSSTELGPVLCIASHLLQTSTEGREDAETPPPGSAFFYLVEFNLGETATYGSDTAVSARAPGSGVCP